MRSLVDQADVIVRRIKQRRDQHGAREQQECNTLFQGVADMMQQIRERTSRYETERRTEAE